MSLNRRILYGLPATVGELAILEETSIAVVNAALCYLRDKGLVRRTERKGPRQHDRGPVPAIWERVR